jgi:hypothetical protein
MNTGPSGYEDTSGSRGSGLGFAGNVVRGYEAEYGIHHPIGLEIDNHASCHIAPATKNDPGGASCSVDATRTSTSPTGCSLKVRSDFTWPTGMNTGQTNVFNAIIKYGLIVVDQGNGTSMPQLSFSRRGIATFRERRGSRATTGLPAGCLRCRAAASPHRYRPVLGQRAARPVPRRLPPQGVDRFGLTVNDLRVVCTSALTGIVTGC